MALLELLKLQEIRVVQPENFADIEIRKTEEE
jgi:chromatin segregation and condensation protein Rec8/ScpA/Scc1 (kleisin family)